MIGRVFLLLGAAACGGEGGTPTAPLAPAGKWMVDSLPTGCRARRTFGPSGDVVLQIVAKPVTATYLVSVDLKRPIKVSYNEPVSVILEPSGQKLDGRALGFRPNAGRPNLVGTFVDAAPFSSGPVSAIGFSVRNDRIAYLAMDHVPALLAVLRKCEDELLVQFGVDMAAQAAVATPPEQISTMEKLFSNDDYPTAAARARAQGTVAGRFRVMPDGSVTDCVVVISSGNAELDRDTCAIWSSRGKFKLAKAKDGRPVASAQTFSVNWSMPPR